MSKITVNTEYNRDMIKQSVNHDHGHCITDISMSILNLREEGVREALIKLGWTPPAEPVDNTPIAHHQV